MPNFSSPLSPRASGFHQLMNKPSNSNMSLEAGIPLTKIRTASSTGGRKKGDTIAQYASNAPLNESNEEEKNGFFARGPAGRRKTAPKRRGTDGEEIKVNSLGRLYNKIVNFSVVTRYFVYVFPVAACIAVPIIIFAIRDPNALFWGTGVKVWLFWTWIEVVWLSLWVSKLAAKLVPYVFMFLCGVVSSGTRKYALMLKAVEMPMSLVGWALTSLVTFTALTAPHLNFGNSFRWITVMKNLLGPALIGSVIFLIEKLLIQLISINYHRRSFHGRIKDSKHSIYLLGLLYEASRSLFPMYCREFLEEDYMINDSIEAHVAKRIHRRSGSATPLKLIGNVGRIGGRVTSVFGNIASEITGKQILNPHSSHSVVLQALEKTTSSEALARRIWMSFVVEGKEALYPEDIQEVLGPDRKEEADEAFAALDSDGNGDVSLDEMIMKVVEVGRDRKAINSSMRDVGQAIGVLDHVVSVILLILIFFMFVAFQDTNFVTTLATAGTTLLSMSFVFAVTTQEFLGSCIFLFVKHPYDVGDRVDIVGPTAECLVVEQISLLFTVFKRIDNMKLVQVPNIVLNTLWIENITRSKAMKEQLDMFISFDTSLEDIETLRKEMEAFVRSPENSRDFHPELIIEATGIGNMDKLQLKVEIRHKSNWHNETVRAARRSKFMCALVLALRKVPIYGPGGGGEPLGGPTNPGYSVAVSDDWAAEARDKAAKKKEERRLIPTTTEPSSPEEEEEAKEEGVLGSAPEEAAAQALNSRRPMSDLRDIDVADDDDTVETSLERARSTKIDNLRQSLLKRESTRGRRKRGETAPQVPTSPEAGVSLAQSSAQGDTAYYGRDRDNTDEEAELGMTELPVGGYESEAYDSYSPPRPRPPIAIPTHGSLRRLSLGFKNAGPARQTREEREEE